MSSKRLSTAQLVINNLKGGKQILINMDMSNDMIAIIYQYVILPDDINYHFLMACNSNDLPLVEDYYLNGADIGAPVDIHRTRKFYGTKYGRYNDYIVGYECYHLVFPIESSTYLGNVEVVKFLHEVGGLSITTQNNLLIRIASENGKLDLVKYLHQNGANITALNNRPVRGARDGGHSNVVEYLLANGAILN